MPFGSFVGGDHLGGDVAGNGISKLFFTIISAVAEAERDRIVQRILDGEAAIAVEMIPPQLHWQLFDRLTGLPEIDEKRQGGPHLRELQAAVRLKIDRRRREQERDPLLVEQHNWINFLDAAAKTEERAWLDYTRRLFSDATAKIDAVEQSQRWLQPRPTGIPQPEMPNAAPTTSKRVSYAIR